jgi:hypothetical protein
VLQDPGRAQNEVGWGHRVMVESGGDRMRKEGEGYYDRQVG